MKRRLPKSDSPEIHVFLIWHNALDHADDILTHVERRFGVLDIVDVEWSRARFADNLTRFYRDTLPPGSEKERHCGIGPFRLLVVEDQEPRHARRPTSRGRSAVNARVFDARAKYRSWTGGGHRVHASLTPREADHDLFLLLGRRAGFYQRADRSDNRPRPRRYAQDLLGAIGWESKAQLLTALEVTLDYVVLPPIAPNAVGGLELLVENTWWAAVTANALETSDSPFSYLVDVADEGLRVDLRSPEDDHRSTAWLSDLLRRRVRGEDGSYLPAPLDRFYLLLSNLVQADGEPSEAAVLELDRLAAECSLRRGDYRDPGFARRALDEFLAASATSPPGTPFMGRLARLVRNARRH